MCISRLRFMFLIFIFFVLFGSLFFSFFLCEPHAFIMLRQKRSSPETTPVVGGRLATVPGFQNYRLKQNSHLSFTVSKNHKKAKLDTARFICAEQLDTILMHTLSLHRRPPPSADGSGLFQDICQWLYKLGYTFFFFVCNIYVYLYVFKNTQFKCICLVDWLHIVLYCFLLFFLYAKLYFVHMLLYI